MSSITSRAYRSSLLSDLVRALVRLLRRFAQLPEDRESLLGGRRLPRAERQPAAGANPDQGLPSPAPRRSGWRFRRNHAPVV